MENSFNSIERLVEFGLGIGIAQQMIRTMNHAMANMSVAGAGNTFLSPDSAFFYAVVDNLQIGPLSENEITELIINKSIDRSTLIWKVGAPAWKTAENIPEVNKLILMNL